MSWDDDEFRHQSCQEMGYAPILANAAISIYHFAGFTWLNFDSTFVGLRQLEIFDKCDEGFFSVTRLGIPATYIGLLSSLLTYFDVLCVFSTTSFLSMDCTKSVI